MQRLNYYEVDEVNICPYCGDIVEIDPHMGCCGEVHAEPAYLFDGETYLVDEVELYKPILDTIYWTYRRWTSKRHYSALLTRFRRYLCQVYDGHNSIVRKFREVSGFRWTKFDCFILRQLHDFPLYYTPPWIAERQRREAKEYMEKLKKRLGY